MKRFHSFSRRFFERFDLRLSLLLRLADNDNARRVESTLKDLFAEHRVAAPEWVPVEAGGRTEWFSAIQFPQAETRLRAFSAEFETAQLLDAAEFIRSSLLRFSNSFEPWACNQAQLICEDIASANLGYPLNITQQPLRDWLDAYRHFDLPLFSEDPAALQFVIESSRLCERGYFAATRELSNRR